MPGHRRIMVGMAPTTLDFHTALQQMFAPYTPARGAAIRVQETVIFGFGSTVEVEAILTPYDLPEQPTARQVREALMESANRAIETVEAFGLRLHEAPRIEFGGRVARRMGQEPLVVTECTLRLNLLRAREQS